MTIVYHEEDGDLTALANKRISVIGYGRLGQPQALNLRDSGVDVVVCDDDAERRQKAIGDGFSVLPMAEATRHSQIIMLLLPDVVMPEIYLQHVSPNLQRGDALIFGSAYNVAYGFIEPPPFVDVGLVAPRILGAAIRERYLSQQGFYTFVAVAQDATGQAWGTVLGLAKAVGSLKAGAIEIGFEREAELDLFVQQAILPAFHNLMLTGANLLLQMGYPPEAVLTDLYISGEFTDYLERAARSGLMHALELSSLTGQYGTLTRMERFNELKLERLMEITLEEIRRGDFAKEWAKEYADGYRRLRRLWKTLEGMDLWELEQQTLDLLYPDRDTRFEAE